MTNKEVINFLKSEKEATRKLASTCNSDKIDYFKKHEEAYNMAIKSLEAWEKVKNDICEIDWYGDDAFWDGVNLVSDIIDKHLAELEGDTNG